MPNDPRADAILAEQRRLAGPPFDQDVLTTVIVGADRLGTWELRDGPHPLPQDPTAIGTELILRHGRHGGFFAGIAPRLRPDQIASTGTTASGHDHERSGAAIGYIEARCQPTVATIRVHYHDSTLTELATTTSPTTGECWAVCPLDTDSIATRVEYLDEQGAVLDTHDVEDPRTWEPE